MGILRLLETKPFPVMNVRTDIQDRELERTDDLKRIVNHAYKIEGFLGDMVLYSDGSLREGSSPDLITKKGVFSVPDDVWDTPRFYWENGGDTPYSIRDGTPFLGYEYSDGSFRSFATMGDKPVFNLEGLYKHKGVSRTFFTQASPDRKIAFLEDFLVRKDKSGFTPKDTLVKNPKARLKLLENHYRNTAEWYSW